MAKKKFKVDILSKNSIEKLKEDLLEYKNDLSRKCDEVVRRLVDVALPIIESHIAEAQITYDEKNIQSGADVTHTTDVQYVTSDGSSRANISVSGKEILFIEFGSGVYYNALPSPHPKGQEFGFVIGSYGKHHGVQQVWGYYDESGELVLTHGVKATMPMYNAFLEIQKQAKKIVKDVFR